MTNLPTAVPDLTDIALGEASIRSATINELNAEVTAAGRVIVGPTHVNGLNHLSGGVFDHASALAELPSGGGVIYLPPGTFGLGAGGSTGMVPAANKALVLRGSGPATILDASGMTGGTALNFVTAGIRNVGIEDMTIKGPGLASSVTGIKTYSGMAMRNVLALNFGTGYDFQTNNGVSIDDSNEIRSCGVGFKMTTFGNMHNLSPRVFTCTKGAILNAHKVNIVGAWFENNTSYDIELQDARAICIRDCWMESASRTAPSIFINPTSTSYSSAEGIIIVGSFFTQSASATEFLEVTQAETLTLHDNTFGEAAYAAIKINTYVERLRCRGNQADRSDGETDKGYRDAITIRGTGRVVSVAEPRSLHSYFSEGQHEMVGGLAWIATTNLLSDSGFESALNVTATGTAAAALDADANLGAQAAKLTFAAASSGASHVCRIDRSFAATSGQWYYVKFAAKASTPFRAVAFRMFNVTSGSYEDVPIPFLELGTSYRPFEIAWSAPATATFRPAFFKNVVTDHDISVWVDDIACFMGLPGPYLPGVTSTIPKGTFAAEKLMVGGDFGFGVTPAAKAAVTGSRGGNAALADLLTKLAAKGLITDGTSA